MLITWMISLNAKITTSPNELLNPVNEGDLLELLPMIAGGYPGIHYFEVASKGLNRVSAEFRDKNANPHDN